MNVRRTNALLRSVNAIRNTINDLKDLAKKPTAAKFFWTLMQISRTYSSLRRLYNLTKGEMTSGALFMGLKPPRTPNIAEAVGLLVAPTLDFSALDVRIDAFRENIPMRLQGIDLSGLPEKSSIMIQAILEEDAEITVNDAKELLSSRILHPEDSTGDLEASIYWEPEVFGTRIIAGMPYAWWVERGHDNFMGHWYMKDATDRARIRLPEKIRMQINGLLSE